MTVDEFVEQRAQQVLAGGDRRGDRQQPARRRALVGDQHVGFLEIGEDPPACGRVAFAGFAQADRAGRPVQQRGARVRLEERDRAADGGRRAAEPPPRSREAALVERGDEHLHRIDSVHGGSAGQRSCGGQWRETSVKSTARVGGGRACRSARGKARRSDSASRRASPQGGGALRRARRAIRGRRASASRRAGPVDARRVRRRTPLRPPARRSLSARERMLEASAIIECGEFADHGVGPSARSPCMRRDANAACTPLRRANARVAAVPRCRARRPRIPIPTNLETR